MNNRLYITGKMAGDPSALSKFMRYEFFYCKQNYDVHNRMLICRQGWSWLHCMVACVWRMSKCQKVAFMPDWVESRAARMDMIVAVVLGKQIEMAEELF